MATALNLARANKEDVFSQSEIAPPAPIEPKTGNLMLRAEIESGVEAF